MSDGIYRSVLGELEKEFPRFQIVRKRDSRLQRLIGRFLRFVTLGRQSRYLDRYHTVIGTTLYVPDSWDTTDPLTKAITLRHEWVHLRQFRRYGKLIMGLLYVLVPLPVGLAYMRAKFEREAYEETLRATLELKGEQALCNPGLRDHVVSQFVGPSYAWMWPFRRSVETWYDGCVERLLQHP